VRHAVKYTRANGDQHEKEKQGNLRVQTFAIGSSRQKNRGQGAKIRINSPSHRCGLVGYYLSPCSGTGSGVVSLRVDHPEVALLLEVVVVPCHEEVISSVFSGIQGECKMTVKE
jgi:hypothetical protein